MIYKGTEYTIELDLREDLNQWAYNVLTTAHFENVNLDRALYQYCNMQLRLLEPKPRKVLVSKELVEKGDHLLPFMSRSIVDVAFKGHGKGNDGCNKNWNAVLRSSGG